nr:hypothetical protein [uncultured Sphingomonas sp.]
MSKRPSLTVTLTAQTLGDLDEVAREWGCTPEQVALTAIYRLINEEAPSDEVYKTLPAPPPEPELEVLDDAAEALRAFIQEGVDSAERGELIPHDEVIAELRRRDEEALGAAKNAA